MQLLKQLSALLLKEKIIPEGGSLNNVCGYWVNSDHCSPEILNGIREQYHVICGTCGISPVVAPISLVVAPKAVECADFVGKFIPEGETMKMACVYWANRDHCNREIMNYVKEKYLLYVSRVVYH